MKQITRVEFEGLNYDFKDTTPLTKDDETYLYALQINNNESTNTSKTSMRIKKSVLWELELISRISTIRGIHDNKTFGDIINNLLQLVYHSDDLQRPYVAFKDLLMTKNFLQKLFHLENGNRKIFTLTELTFSTDLIIRTLKLAIFEKHLLSLFEKRLLKAILTNENFVRKPFDTAKMEFMYDPDDFTDLLIAFLKNEAELKWYEIYDFFGIGSSENFIQGRVNLIELHDHDDSPLEAKGWEYMKYERKNLVGPDQEEYDQLNEKEQKEYLIEKTKYDHYSELDWLVKEGNGRFDYRFKKAIQLKRKQGDYSTAI